MELCNSGTRGYPASVIPRLPTRLLSACRTLLLGLAVLCLLAKPVLAAAHELHDAEHTRSALAEGLPHDADSRADAPQEGALDGLLHALDCCLHASAVMPESYDWAAVPRRHQPPAFVRPPHWPALTSRFLRPPISA